MVLSGIGVVEAIHLNALRGRVPSDALVVLARGNDGVSLDSRCRVEVLAGVGIVQAVHRLGGGGIGVGRTGIVRSGVGSAGIVGLGGQTSYTHRKRSCDQHRFAQK